MVNIELPFCGTNQLWFGGPGLEGGPHEPLAHTLVQETGVRFCCPAQPWCQMPLKASKQGARALDTTARLTQLKGSHWPHGR